MMLGTTNIKKNVEERNYRNKIMYIKLESEVDYHQDARSTTL